MYRLKLLGGASIEGPDGPLGGAIAQRQRLAFLAVLSMAPTGLVSRDNLLALLPQLVLPGGIAAFISFHSLEDRRVKRALADLARTGHWELLTQKPITPSRGEQADNRRSRSSRMRAASRTGPNAIKDAGDVDGAVG